MLKSDHSIREIRESESVIIPFERCSKVKVIMKFYKSLKVKVSGVTIPIEKCSEVKKDHTSEMLKERKWSYHFRNARKYILFVKCLKRESAATFDNLTSVRLLNESLFRGEMVGLAFFGWESVERCSSVGSVIRRWALQIWNRGENITLKVKVIILFGKLKSDFTSVLPVNSMCSPGVMAGFALLVQEACFWIVVVHMYNDTC